MSDDARGNPFFDAFTARLGQVAVDKGFPAAMGYMAGPGGIAGLSPSEHLAGELSGLGDLPQPQVGPPPTGFEGYAGLPSGAASYELVKGDLGALPGVAFYTTARGALIALGLYAAGERDRWKLIKYSAGASVAVQLWILWWATTRRPGRS